jgi:hypothetical protein
MRWVRDPSQSNIDNLNNIKRETSGPFRNTKKISSKDKIEELILTLKLKMLGTCIGASVTLRRVTV